MATTETRTVADTALQKRLIFAWLDALRSGEWKQTKMHLEDRCGNCCLGVACRVYQLHGGELKTKFEEKEGVVVFGNTENDENWAGLPLNVRDAVGFVDSLGQYGPDVRDALYNDNDTGATFPEIADIIEQNAATLFVNGDEVAGWLAERRQEKQ